MKWAGRSFKDIGFLFVSGLTISSGIITLGFLDIPLSLKLNIFFYFSMACLFIVVLDLTKPFRADYKLFGFKSKAPMRWGAYVNGCMLVVALIIFRSEFEGMFFLRKVGILTLELLLWLGVMWLIGHFLVRRNEMGNRNARKSNTGSR